MRERCEGCIEDGSEAGCRLEVHVEKREGCESAIDACLEGGADFGVNRVIYEVLVVFQGFPDCCAIIKLTVFLIA